MPKTINTSIWVASCGFWTSLFQYF